MASIFVTDHDSKHEITNIHIYDASGPTWSGNLLNAPLPYALLPAVPAVGDCLYFGSDTMMAVVGGTFYNIVFNIAIAGSGYTAEWEWLAWNDTALVWFWGAPNPFAPAQWDRYDETNFLMTAGNNRIAMYPLAWIPPAPPVDADFARPANLNTILGSGPSVTGYWFRLRITGITAPTAPVQAEEHPYYANKPFVEIDNNDEIKGDIHALASIQYKNETNFVTPEIIKIGLRTYDRGPDFNAWIHTTDKGNIPGITVTSIAGTGFVDWYLATYAPSDRCHEYPLPGGVPFGETEIIRIYFDETIAPQYSGVFRCILISKWSANPLGPFPADEFDISYKLKIGAGNMSNIIFESKWRGFSDWIDPMPSYNGEWVDFGQITIPEMSSAQLTNNRIWFRIYIKERDGCTRAYTHSLLLLPVDESYTEIVDSAIVTGSFVHNTWARIDNTNYPKHGVCGPIISSTNDKLQDNAFVTAPSGFYWQRGKRQRLWSFFAVDLGEVDWVYMCLPVRAEKVERYLSMRGDR